MSLGFTDLYYFINDELVTINVSTNITKNKISVYEVIRIIGGIPLYIEDHIIRLYKSLVVTGLNDEKYSLNNFKNKIASLCEANQKYFGNIEIRINKNQNSQTNCYLGFIPHQYPEPIDYIEGVPVNILNAVRENPNAKIKGSNARKLADGFIKNNSCYEVLLANNKGIITEGSRSNFFYIINSEVYSAPTKLVLPGITRKYVITAIKDLNISLNLNALKVSNLEKIDAAFISGTSLGILPLKSIDSIKLNAGNEMLKKMMMEYNVLVQEYLSNYKS